MLAKSALVTTPMTGRFIDEVKPGEKGDHGASALSTSAIMFASAGTDQQCTVEAAVFEVFAWCINGGRGPDDCLRFLIMNIFATQTLRE